MSHSRWITGASILIALGGCHRQPSDRTPEGTLARLRESLATGTPALDRVADVRLIAEARALQQARSLEERFGVPITAEGMNAVIAEHAAETDPHTFFAGVLPMLGRGHCERIGDAPVPDLIRPPPEPGEHWTPHVMDLQVSVARRAQSATAADYRCDGGLSFGAVFAHPYPDDGTWRVVSIVSARHP